MHINSAAVAFATLLAAVPAWSNVSEADSLRGITGVQVVIERLHADAESVNLSAAVIEIVVREKLREAGLTFLSLDERMVDPRRPYVYVNCNLIYVESIQLATFSIDIEVHQRVTLEGGERAQALTWAKSYLGVQGKDTAAAKVREVIEQLMDQFHADFRRAHTSKSSTDDDIV
jgi:hypothetical protein